MDCVADWLATGVDAADALGSAHCGLHSYTTSIAARNARGQQSSHSFLANSSDLFREWFIALTQTSRRFQPAPDLRRCFSA